MLNNRLSALMDLAGKRALITGGARGIGRGIANLLLEAGAEVMIVDYTIDDEVRRSADGSAILLEGDLADVSVAQSIFDAAVRRLGRVDILVNNAAYFPHGTIAKLDVEQWDRTIDTNLRAAFLLTQGFANHVSDRGPGGRIVNISSLNTSRTYVGMPHYDASKAGLEALTRSAALELAAHDVTVNAVAPGGVLTPGSMNVRKAKGFPDTEEGVAARAAQIPLGRPCSPEDIARAVWFFTSDAASYVTGQILYVEGGVLIGPSPRA